MASLNKVILIGNLTAPSSSRRSPASRSYPLRSRSTAATRARTRPRDSRRLTSSTSLHGDSPQSSSRASSRRASRFSCAARSSRDRTPTIRAISVMLPRSLPTRSDLSRASPSQAAALPNTRPTLTMRRRRIPTRMRQSRSLNPSPTRMISRSDPSGRMRHGAKNL